MDAVTPPLRHLQKCATTCAIVCRSSLVSQLTISHTRARKVVIYGRIGIHTSFCTTSWVWICQGDLNGRLCYTIADEISDQVWCEHDWLSLDYDEMLNLSWKRFCWTIQHERRFFFAIPKEKREENEYWISNREEFNPPELLSQIVHLANELELVSTFPAGTKF